jgi:hypothetical protein
MVGMARTAQNGEASVARTCLKGPGLFVSIREPTTDLTKQVCASPRSGKAQREAWRRGALPRRRERGRIGS